MSLLVRFIVLSNNYLQIRDIKKTDEGTYRCEGRILARGEINFKDIQVIVNGEEIAFFLLSPLVAPGHPQIMLRNFLFGLLNKSRPDSRICLK